MLDSLVSFSAFLLDSNGYKQAVGHLAQWTSLTAALQPRPFEKAGSFIRKGNGEGQILAGTTNRSGRMAVREISGALSRIEIQPLNPVTLPNLSKQLKAIGVFSDGSTQDLTASVLWSSSNTAVAQVHLNAKERGKVYGLSAGTVTVTATLGQVAGSATLSVSSATVSSMTLSPPTSLPVGHVVRFKALATLSDNTVLDVTDAATWYSTGAVSGYEVASAGSLYLTTAGVKTVAAYLPTTYAFASYTLTSASLSSMTILPLETRVPIGAEAQLSLHIALSDNTSLDVTEQATWTSSDDQLAQVANDWAHSGRLTALKAGTVTLTARYKGQVQTKVYTITE